MYTYDICTMPRSRRNTKKRKSRVVVNQNNDLQSERKTKAFEMVGTANPN